MEVNKQGRTYQRGKALSDEVRSMIIDEFVENGGDIRTGYFPGSFDNIAKKFKLKIDTVKKVWKTFHTTGEFKRPKPCSSGVKHLQPEDLEFIENKSAINDKWRTAQEYERVLRTSDR